MHGTASTPRSRRLLAAASGKYRMASNEASRLFGMAPTWFDRVHMARFLAKLYVARALPVNTYKWSTSVRLRGSRYTFGLRTSEIYVLEEVFNYGLYDLISDYVPRPGWVVVDVGANVGVVSMRAAEQGARVYAFEPNPECFGRLLRNIVGNGLDHRIQAFNAALGDEVAEGAMCVSKGGTTGGTVVMAGDAQDPRPVTITTLDRMAEALGVKQVDLLKIDVEGAEVAVLRGASKVLGFTQRMIVEYHSRALLEEVQELSRGWGFELERKVVYYPESESTGQAEVGMLYLRRRGVAAAAQRPNENGPR